MSNDLVKRLRSPANVFYEYAADGGAFLCEAADEIERLRAALELYRDAVLINVLMSGPRFVGSNVSALKRAWEHDRAALTEGEK